MYWQKQLPAPTNSFELKVGTGYTQGFGRILPDGNISNIGFARNPPGFSGRTPPGGGGIPNVAGAGIGVPVDMDYRYSPHGSFGVQAEYQEFTSEQNSAARGLAANLGGTYHASPFSRSDFWARFGAGYRLLWSVDPPGLPTTLIHGFEAAKLTLGWDIRMSRGVAIAPVAGADLNVFVWATANGNTIALPTAQVGSFVYAGLQARFDAGPTVVNTPVVANLR
jgi:hypothetical protein